MKQDSIHCQQPNKSLFTEQFQLCKKKIDNDISEKGQLKSEWQNNF